MSCGYQGYEFGAHYPDSICCDGSERYPVYARWEIEEMLAAAGIKWEAE